MAARALGSPRRQPDGTGFPVLEVRDLIVSFPSRHGIMNAVDRLSFAVRAGEIVGLVGESGSGKTTVGMAVLRLVPAPGRIANGQILVNGQDVLSLSVGDMRKRRGREVALVVQDALAAMNPVTTVEEQVGEVVQDHEGGTRASIRQRVLDILKRLDMPRAEKTLKLHAHELSGGMQQRVVIAGATILNPKLLIADEPTTAVDVTVQAQILEVLRAIRDHQGTSILFISHDLAVVTELCNRVLVMYAAELVEGGRADAVLARPLHPYTQALLSAQPPLVADPPNRLEALGGSPPDLAQPPSGCRFHPRCPLRDALGSPAVCETSAPPRKTDGEQWATCHFPAESRDRWRARTSPAAV